MAAKSFNSVNDCSNLVTLQNKSRNRMRLSGWYLAIALALLGLSGTTAKAQETWEQRAWGYLFGSSSPDQTRALAPQDITIGLKRTLHLSAEYAAIKLGHYDGFAKDSSVRIQLPPKFQKARDLLGHFGLSGRLDDLELQMNRAAENAVPDILPAIHHAIEQLSIANPGKIAAGPDDAATAYFSFLSDSDLQRIIRPIIDKQLQEVGTPHTLAIIDHGLHALPMAPNLKFDATAYVSEKTLAGIYQYMARKEQKIRHRPGATRDPIIKQLFSDD